MCGPRALAVAALVGVGIATGGFGLAGAGAAGAGATGATAATAAGATAAGATAATAATVAAPAATGLSALQTASLLTSAAGTGLSVYGQYKQAEASKKAAEYNQKVAEVQARDAITRGEYESEAMGRKVGAMRGRQRAAMAANGLDLSYGSPAAVLDQTDYYGLEDQRTVATNARREAAMYASRGTAYGMQAQSTDPLLTAGGSLLTGAGNVADRWYRYRG